MSHCAISYTDACVKASFWLMQLKKGKAKEIEVSLVNIDYYD